MRTIYRWPPRGLDSAWERVASRTGRGRGRGARHTSGSPHTGDRSRSAPTLGTAPAAPPDSHLLSTLSVVQHSHSNLGAARPLLVGPCHRGSRSTTLPQWPLIRATG
jgi:hypothetical protein